MEMWNIIARLAFNFDSAELLWLSCFLVALACAPSKNLCAKSCRERFDTQIPSRVNLT